MFFLWQDRTSWRAVQHGRRRVGDAHRIPAPEQSLPHLRNEPSKRREDPVDREPALPDDLPPDARRQSSIWNRITNYARKPTNATTSSCWRGQSVVLRGVVTAVNGKLARIRRRRHPRTTTMSHTVWRLASWLLLKIRGNRSHLTVSILLCRKMNHTFKIIGLKNIENTLTEKVFSKTTKWLVFSC